MSDAGKWTPGPYFAEANTSSGWNVFGADAYQIGHVAQRASFLEDSDAPAELFEDRSEDELVAESEANLGLWLASPEMAELLERTANLTGTVVAAIEGAGLRETATLLRSVLLEQHALLAKIKGSENE